MVIHKGQFFFCFGVICKKDSSSESTFFDIIGKVFLCAVKTMSMSAGIVFSFFLFGECFFAQEDIKAKHCAFTRFDP